MGFVRLCLVAEEACVGAVLLYLAIPVTSALVGWGTNVLAIKMMFFPLEPVGRPPFLGWQGIIPAKVRKMATIIARPTATSAAATAKKAGEDIKDGVKEALNDNDR